MAVPGRKPGDSFPLASSVNEMLLRTRKGLIIQPAAVEEIAGRYPSLVSTFEAGVRSMMSVPLISRDKVIGGLHFRSKEPNSYTAETLRLAERIGAQIAGAIANAQLFADLKNTGSSLRESEGRFRALFEQAAVGVSETDMFTGRYITVNRRLCEMVGRTEEEMLATTFLAITHPDDLHLHEEKTALLLAGKIGYYSLEKRYHPEGRRGRLGGCHGIAALETGGSARAQHRRGPGHHRAQATGRGAPETGGAPATRGEDGGPRATGGWRGP